MACPACGCNETYQYNDGEDYDLGDELIRCAACGAIFELEDETPEVDELHPLAGLHINQGSMDAAAMDEAANEFNTHHEEMMNVVEALTQQLAAANGRVERMREALLLCEGFVRAYGQPETRAIVAAALSDLPEADKEKS